MDTGPFPQVKRRDVALSSHLIAPRLNKEYSYTSAHLWAFTDCSNVNVTFTFTFTRI
jgi:hypothetical protein